MTADTSNLSLFQRAQRVTPGGVNSPVRAYNSVGGTPPFIASASGAHVTDVEGNTYLDYVMSWGPLLFGHADPEITQAALAAVQRGSSFGAPTETEVLLAETIVERLAYIEQVRFVSSGTEAVMTAIRLARGYTGKNLVIKFDGHYHGHSDSMLVGAGSGAITMGVPNSPGVTAGTAQDTIVVPWNDPEALTAAFTHHADIAAIIYEPVACNVGCIPAVEGFHDLIRTLATTHNALVVVDEVMTGFRLAYRGAVDYYGLHPDLVTFGKVIGGGYPLAGVGGSTDIMSHLAPVGPVYQAGTLSGNPVATAAGLAQLRKLTPETYETLTQTAATLTDGITRILRGKGIGIQVPRVTTMFAMYFADEPVTTVEQAKQADHAMFARFFHHMLEKNITLPPSGYEAWFVSTSHTGVEIERTLEAVDSFQP